MGDARHVYLIVGERAHCGVEVISQTNVDVADFLFGRFGKRPLR